MQADWNGQTATAAVRLSHVSVTYQSVVALMDVTLDVPVGGRLAVVGESGAGKSTLLNVIAGLTRPTKGDVQIQGGRSAATGDNNEAEPKSVWRRLQGWLVGEDRRGHDGVAILFQSDGLFPWQTASGNVAYPLRARGLLGRREIGVQVRHMLERVGLSHRLNAYPGTLSGGERKRVAMARALVMSPTVLLLDEPTGNLDAELRQQTRELILDLHQHAGFALVVVTHDPVEAAQLGEQVAVLSAGRIMACAAAKELYWRAPSVYVARLFGHCNVLSSQCVSVGPEAATVEVLGRTVTVPVGQGCVRTGSPVTVLVRPEVVHLQPGGHADEAPGMFGTVVRVTDLARFLSIIVRIDGSETLIEAHMPAFPVGVGSRVRCEPEWHRAWCLATPGSTDT